MRLENKVALVTGGGSGIGRATAELFAKEGARVVVADLDETTVSESAEQIKAAGGGATAIVGDVSISQDADRMVRVAVESYGRLDILVNSAGITHRGLLKAGASPEQAWDKVMEVNLKGTYLVSWFAVPEMERSGGGSIVNLASIMSLVGYPTELTSGFNPYGPSKGGVLQFTRNLAIDGAKNNIRVNCICPGFVMTSLIKALVDDEQKRKLLEDRHPLGRLGRPEEIAYAALFLASDESSFVTGAPLIVDGGYTAQ